MAKKHLPSAGSAAAELNRSITRIDQDLDILDVHPGELSAAERDIQVEMKKTDREYKDAHFHSIPKPIKHTTP